MATDEKQSFAQALSTMSATLQQAVQVASSLSMMHEAEIQNIVNTLTAHIPDQQAAMDLKLQVSSSCQSTEMVHGIDLRPNTAWSALSLKSLESVQDSAMRTWPGIAQPSLGRPFKLAPLDTTAGGTHQVSPLFGDDVIREKIEVENTLSAPAETGRSNNGLNREKVEVEKPFFAPYETERSFPMDITKADIRGMWKGAELEVEAPATDMFTVGPRAPHWNSKRPRRGNHFALVDPEDTSYPCEPFCGILNPVGQIRFYWNVVCFVLIVYDLFAVPMQAFKVDAKALQLIEWIITIWWTLDLFLTFRTGYIVGQDVEMRPKKIALHYARTWLLCDLIIVVLEWVCRFMAASGSASFLRSSRALRTFRLIKLIRVTKVYVLGKHLQDQLNSNVFTCCITITISGSVVVLLIHITACIWYAIGENRHDGWTTQDRYEGEKDWMFWYMASLRWAISQFNGRTDQNMTRNMPERFFTCVVGIVLAVVLNAILISVITKTLLELSELVSEETRRRRAVTKYLVANPLPPTLRFQVKQCVKDYREIDRDLQNEKDVFTILPLQIQADVLYAVRSPVLMKHPFFFGVRFESPWVMRLLCQEMVQTVSATKSQIIFDKGDVCDRILFTSEITATYGKYKLTDDDSKPDSKSSSEMVQTIRSRMNHGQISEQETSEEVLQSVAGRELQNVRRGSWVSELALWIEWRNQGCLVSTDRGFFFGIQASKLALALKKHPDTHALAFMYGQRLAGELSTVNPGDWSDMLPFEVKLHLPMRVMVTIVSAANLRTVDDVTYFHCFCKVIGLTGKSSEVRFKTRTPGNSWINPVWNDSAEVVLSGYQLLEFSVWAEQDSGITQLGMAHLAAQKRLRDIKEQATPYTPHALRNQPDGFEDDLELTNSDGFSEGSVKVKIQRVLHDFWHPHTKARLSRRTQVSPA